MTGSPFQSDVTRQTFAAEVLERSRQTPVLVDFWAAWCGPCKMLMPVLHKLAEEYQGKFFLAKVNSDDEQQLANQYGVRSLPTVKLFMNGQVVDEFMGVQPEAAIRALLDRHIPRESDAMIRQAVEAARAGNAEEALALLQRAMALDPASDRVKLELARFLVLLRRVDEAEQILNAASSEARNSDQAQSLRAQFEFARVVQNARPLETLQQAVAANPRDSAARYELACHLVLNRQYEPALELLLGIVQTDRKWNDDAARKAMVAVFSLLGSNELMAQYRRKLSMALN